MKRQREAHGKSTHNKQGNVYKILLLVRVRVCVSFLAKQPPTNRDYIKILLSPPFVPCSCVRCACGGGAVVVCSNVFLCGCLLCIFPAVRPVVYCAGVSLPLSCVCVCALWCNGVVICVCVGVCLCWDISAVRPVVNHTKVCPESRVCPCVPFCVPLCSFTSPRRAPWGALHRSVSFVPACRQCQACATYRAIGGYGFMCVLSVFSVFCFPRRAPWG